MKRVWKIGLAVGLIVLSWTVGSALAASMSDSSRTLAAGNATVARCDTDGVKTVYVLTTTNVTSVTVSNISSGCAGATMKITINNQVTTSSGTGTVPAGGGSLTITVTSIAVTQVMENEISVL